MIAHEPTEQSRNLARTLSGLGIPQAQICTLIGVSKPLLHKYYREELDTGMAEANSKIAGSLFNQAIGGNVTAAIFWAKVRLGWTETNIVHIGGEEGNPVVHRIERVIIDPKPQPTDS